MNIQLEVWPNPETSIPREFSTSAITIGRSRSCDLTVADDAISSKHAHLQVTDRGLIVVDLESTNGTFVNGDPLVSERTVNVGDEIRFGTEGPKIRIIAIDLEGERHAGPQLRPFAFAGGQTPATPANGDSVAELAIIGSDAAAVPATAPPAAAAGGESAPSTTQMMLRDFRESQRRSWRIAIVVTAVVCFMLAVGGLVIFVWMMGRGNGSVRPIVKKYGDSVFVVWVKSDEKVLGTATAFVIDENGTFATNAHVVELIKEVEDLGGQATLIGPGGKFELHVKSSKRHSDYVDEDSRSADVGILKASVPEGLRLMPIPIASKREMNRFVEAEGADIFYIGFPDYREGDFEHADHESIGARVYAGNVVRFLTAEGRADSDLDKRLVMEHSMQSWHGASGSPIFNDSGKVVAILSGGRPVDAGLESWGVRVDLLYDVLDKD